MYSISICIVLDVSQTTIKIFSWCDKIYSEYHQTSLRVAAGIFGNFYFEFAVGQIGPPSGPTFWGFQKALARRHAQIWAPKIEIVGAPSGSPAYRDTLFNSKSDEN